MSKRLGTTTFGVPKHLPSRHPISFQSVRCCISAQNRLQFLQGLVPPPGGELLRGRTILRASWRLWRPAQTTQVPSSHRTLCFLQELGSSAGIGEMEFQGCLTVVSLPSSYCKPFLNLCELEGIRPSSGLSWPVPP